MYKQLMKVSKGFKLVYIGILLIILGVIGGMLGMCIAGGVIGAGAGRGAGALAMLVAGGMLLCVLLGAILGLVGRFFCLAVPERAGAAKPLIIISVIFELTGMALGVFNNVTGLIGRPLGGAQGMGLQGASVLCSLASAVLFLLFTRSVALFVRRNDLADAAMMVLWLWIATIVCYGIGFGVILSGVAAGGAAGAGGAGMAGGACLGSIVMLVAMVIALVALIRYVNLLREMSDATAEFAGSGQYPRRRRRKRRDETEEDEEDEDEEEEEDYPRRSRRDDW